MNKDTDYIPTRVQRGCTKRADCLPASIGPDVEFCEELDLGNSKCSSCNYGPSSPKDGSPDMAQCNVPPPPSRSPQAGLRAPHVVYALTLFEIILGGKSYVSMTSANFLS